MGKVQGAKGRGECVENGGLGCSGKVFIRRIRGRVCMRQRYPRLFFNGAVGWFGGGP